MGLMCYDEFVTERKHPENNSCNFSNKSKINYILSYKLQLKQLITCTCSAHQLMNKHHDIFRHSHRDVACR